MNRPAGTTAGGRPGTAVTLPSAGSGGSLADVLERVLDKGVVIVGDIAVSVLDTELLTLRLRLFVASAQTAREMGLDWWLRDPHFSGPRPAVGPPAAAGPPPAVDGAP